MTEPTFISLGLVGCLEPDMMLDACGIAPHRNEQKTFAHFQRAAMNYFLKRLDQSADFDQILPEGLRTALRESVYQDASRKKELKK